MTKKLLQERFSILLDGTDYLLNNFANNIANITLNAEQSNLVARHFSSAHHMLLDIVKILKNPLFKTWFTTKFKDTVEYFCYCNKEYKKVSLKKLQNEIINVKKVYENASSKLKTEDMKLISDIYEFIFCHIRIANSDANIEFDSSVLDNLCYWDCKHSIKANQKPIIFNKKTTILIGYNSEGRLKATKEFMQAFCKNVKILATTVYVNLKRVQKVA